jgi:hypothetical protein
MFLDKLVCCQNLQVCLELNNDKSGIVAVEKVSEQLTLTVFMMDTILYHNNQYWESARLKSNLELYEKLLVHQLIKHAHMLWKITELLKD